MKTIKGFALGVIISVIAAFILLKGCGTNYFIGSTNTADTTITRDTTIKLVLGDFAWDNPQADTVYTPKKVEKQTDSFHDTSYIMLDYPKFRRYTRTFQDSSVEIRAELGVQFNKLQSLDLDYELTQTNVTETRTITQRSVLEVYGGVNTTFETITPVLSVRYGNHLFTGGYNGERVMAGYQLSLYSSE